MAGAGSAPFRDVFLVRPVSVGTAFGLGLFAMRSTMSSLHGQGWLSGTDALWSRKWPCFLASYVAS